jgi:hypothetical protein
MRACYAACVHACTHACIACEEAVLRRVAGEDASGIGGGIVGWIGQCGWGLDVPVWEVYALHTRRWRMPRSSVEADSVDGTSFEVR